MWFRPRTVLPQYGFPSRSASPRHDSCRTIPVCTAKSHGSTQAPRRPRHAICTHRRAINTARVSIGPPMAVTASQSRIQLPPKSYGVAIERRGAVEGVAHWDRPTRRIEGSQSPLAIEVARPSQNPACRRWVPFVRLRGRFAGARLVAHLVDAVGRLPWLRVHEVSPSRSIMCRDQLAVSMQVLALH